MRAEVCLKRGSHAWADFAGPVVKIQDGDSLMVLANGRRIRVRLESIDAPERAQPFGEKSRESLAELCTGKVAEVVEQPNKDRYGRTLGLVTCAGVDVGSEQLKRGMAWVFVRFAAKNSPLYAIQEDARASKRGLWSDAGAVEPWEWRRRTRTGHPTPPR